LKEPGCNNDYRAMPEAELAKKSQRRSEVRALKAAIGEV